MGGDSETRAAAARQPVPELGAPPFSAAPPLPDARVAIVTTAALRRADQPTFERGDQSFRLLDASTDGLSLGHGSPNFDRSGWLTDPDVVFPVNRLAELAGEQVIGSVSPVHVAFAGNQDETMTTIRLDSGPAAADLLRRNGVHVVLITGV